MLEAGESLGLPPLPKQPLVLAVPCLLVVGPFGSFCHINELVFFPEGCSFWFVTGGISSVMRQPGVFLSQGCRG